MRRPRGRPGGPHYNLRVIPLLVAFAVSLAVTLLVVRSVKSHARFSLDHDLSGPQKFHARAVPRIGGVGIFAGLLLALVPLALRQPEVLPVLAGLLACGLPAFGVGLIEDLTKRVSPRMRLVAIAVSATLAAGLLGAVIPRTDIPGLDSVVAYAAGAWLLTLFAVVGTANSVNIIDGFNGLASMCVVLMLGALGYVGGEVGDRAIVALSLAGIGAVLGFFVWNFPGGLVFLGDGGAYFLGFYTAEVAILLLARNAQVSPLFPLLVCIYPVFETLFSIYRRRFLRAVPPHLPDGIHLHSLVYRRVMRWAVGDDGAKALARRNSRTSPVLWALSMVSLVPAVLFWDSSPAMAFFLLTFAVAYVGLYWRIVRFRSPRLLRIFGSRPMPLDAGDNRRT